MTLFLNTYVLTHKENNKYQRISNICIIFFKYMSKLEINIKQIIKYNLRNLKEMLLNNK